MHAPEYLLPRLVLPNACDGREPAGAVGVCCESGTLVHGALILFLKVVRSNLFLPICILTNRFALVSTQSVEQQARNARLEESSQAADCTSLFHVLYPVPFAPGKTRLSCL